MSAAELRADNRVGYSVREAAEAAGLRVHHIRQALAEGTLISRAVARRTVILKDDLVSFLRSRPSPRSSRAKYNTAEELGA